MIDLEALERAIRRDRDAEVLRLYDGVSEAEREATKPLIRSLEKEEAAWWRSPTSDLPFAKNPVGSAGLAIAQLATTPSPERAAEEFDWGTWPEKTAVVLGRPAAWQRRLAEILAGTLMRGGASQAAWDVIDPILQHLGLRHLDTPDYAVHWLRRQEVTLDADAQFTVDPELPTLLLRALDSDRLHDAVPPPNAVWEAEGKQRRWAELAGQWVREGKVDRTDLHNRALACLVRGGMKPHLRAALDFVEELSPTPEEALAHRREYLALVESKEAFVARHALAALRGAEADRSTAVIACEVALTRADAGVPQAALVWLRALAKGTPEAAAEVVRVAGIGLSHPKRIVQEKALALVGSLPAGDAAAEIAWAMEAVSPSIRGASTESAPALPELPPLLLAPPLPRIESVDELIDLVRRAAKVGPTFGDDERLIDGFARFGASLTPQQKKALPLRDRSAHWPMMLNEFSPIWRPSVADRLLRPRRPVRARRALAPNVQRAREVLSHLQDEVLLSFPRDGTGLIDPDRLLDDLRRAQRESRPVLPRDLEAAWLRLPLDLDHGFLSQLETIGGEAASWLVSELRRGPVPGPELNLELRDNSNYPYVALMGEWPGTSGRGGGLLLRLSTPRADGGAHLSEEVDVALLPPLREALALHDLKALEWWRGTVNQTAPLIAFPHQQGALGPASHLALADAATADHTQLRAAATDATLGLLATGALDGVAAGPAWALAAPLPSYKLGRWASHLRDVAASSVAGSRYVWNLLRQALPVLFEATRARPGAADLVGIAAEAALVVGARESVPGLDAVADRSGSARLTVEARRLRTVLSG